MTQYHAKGLRKKSGGMRRYAHKKKKYELGGVWVETKVGETVRKAVRGMGGNEKMKLFSTNTVNVANPKTKEVKKVKILGVLEHLDNPHFTRRVIVTKGCTVKTELGTVRITSRPGQDGVVNGILLG